MFGGDSASQSSRSRDSELSEILARLYSSDSCQPYRAYHAFALLPQLPQILHRLKLWGPSECMVLHMLLCSLTPSFCRSPAFRLGRQPWTICSTPSAACSRRFLQQSHKHYFSGRRGRTENDTGVKYRHTAQNSKNNASDGTARQFAPLSVKGRGFDNTVRNTFDPDKQVCHIICSALYWFWY